MKYLLLPILLGLTLHLHAQQLKPGDPIPSLTFSLLAEEVPCLSSESLTGKVILLDFWATWCGPCISSMPHLDQLQTTFGDDLRIIAISAEKRERLTRFISTTDHRFLFAQDTGALRALFPYRVIPHSVLISPLGVVVAITSPEHITEEVIEKVLRGESPTLPIKQERMDFDPSYDYFQADTLAQFTFELQPYNPDLPSFSKRYGSGPFKNRRLTAYNHNIDGLYRMAYGKSSQRLELNFSEALIDWKEESNRYCMDVIVPDENSLYGVVQQQLNTTLPYKARLEKRTKEVVVIKTLAGKVLAEVGEPTSDYSGRSDGFESEGATVATFCSYLEDFGIFGYPVVDESGTEAAYRLDFSYDPENPETFRAAMNQLGLSYAKATREIEVLVLYLEQ